MNTPSQPGSPLRVCMLMESYAPVVGGMETQARNVSRGLRELGCEVFVVTRRPSRKLPREEVLEGTRVIRCGPTGASSRLRWALVLTSLPVLLRERKNYDAILVPGLRALGLAAVWAGRLLRKPVVLKAASSGELSGAFFAGGFEHSHLSPGGWPARLFLRLRNRVLLRAQAFVSLSSEQEAEFLSCGVSLERIHRIGQTVQTQRFTPADGNERTRLREVLGLPHDALIACYTGRLVSYKGLPLLLDIWRDILSEVPHAHLLLVGPGGVDIYNCEDDLRERVQREGLADSVTLTGSVNNVDEYLRASDLYAFPTQNDALPLSLLEAMAVGLPPLTTPIGGIRDVVRHGENGWLVKPGDADSLRDGLRLLLRDAELRARLGHAARETVLHEFTVEAVSRRYLERFQCLLQDTCNTSVSDG